MSNDAAKEQIDAAKKVAENEAAELEKIRQAAEESFAKWLSDRPLPRSRCPTVGHYPFDEYKDGKLPNLLSDLQSGVQQFENKIVPGKNGNALQLTATMASTWALATLSAPSRFRSRSG